MEQSKQSTMKVQRSKRWGHPETVALLETVLDKSGDFAIAKGRLENRLKFFATPEFCKVKARTPEQMNTRLENLLKEYRKVIKYVSCIICIIS